MNSPETQNAMADQMGREEMAERDAMAAEHRRPATACCVCGQPITDSVCFASSDAVHHWHLRCDGERCAKPCAVKH